MFMLSNAVLKEQCPVQASYVGLTLIQGGKCESRPRTGNELVLVGSLLVLLQILDGILTAAGVGTYGLHAEGNPLLRALMELVGAIPALLITKAACIGLIVLLCEQARSIRWLPLALKGVACIYTVMAVLPWTYILATEYLG
jgi:uncharacterized membrane protein